VPVPGEVGPPGDVEPGDVVVEPGEVVGESPVGLAPGRGEVPGEAAGVRSAGRSPVRPLGDSVHPASTALPSASTKKPLSNFFIAHSLLWAAFRQAVAAAIEVPPSGAPLVH
jgi:hypothetical protein